MSSPEKRKKKAGPFPVQSSIEKPQVSQLYIFGIDYDRKYAQVDIELGLKGFGLLKG